MKLTEYMFFYPILPSLIWHIVHFKEPICSFYCPGKKIKNTRWGIFTEEEEREVKCFLVLESLFLVGVSRAVTVLQWQRSVFEKASVPSWALDSCWAAMRTALCLPLSSMPPSSVANHPNLCLLHPYLNLTTTVLCVTSAQYTSDRNAGCPYEDCGPAIPGLVDTVMFYTQPPLWVCVSINPESKERSHGVTARIHPGPVLCPLLSWEVGGEALLAQTARKGQSGVQPDCNLCTLCDALAKYRAGNPNSWKKQHQTMELGET